MIRHGHDVGLGVDKNDRTLHVSTSLLCNLSCIFCNEGPRAAGYLVDRIGRRKFHRTQRELDVNAFTNLLKYRQRFQDVIFSHGEPTLNQSLPKYVDIARRVGYRKIEVITNAVRFSDRTYVRKLVAAGMTHATVSFHAADARINELIVGASGARDKALSGMRNAAAEGARVTLNFVLVRLNLPDLLHTLLVARGCGAAAAVVSFVRLERFPPEKVAMNLVRYADFIRAVRPLAPRLNALADQMELRFTDFPPCVLAAAGLDYKKLFGLVKAYATDEFGEEKASATIVRRRKPRSCGACALSGSCEGVETYYLKIDPAPPLVPFSD